MAKPDEKEKLLANIIDTLNRMSDADLKKTAAFIKELEIVSGKTKTKGEQTKHGTHT